MTSTHTEIFTFNDILINLPQRYHQLYNEYQLHSTSITSSPTYKLLLNYSIQITTPVQLGQVFTQHAQSNPSLILHTIDHDNYTNAIAENHNNIFTAIPITSTIHQHYLPSTNQSQSSDQSNISTNNNNNNNTSHLSVPPHDYFTQTHFPHTLYPYDTNPIQINSKSLLSPYPYISPSNRSHIPSIQTQIDSFQIDMVKIMEGINSTLHYLNFTPNLQSTNENEAIIEQHLYSNCTHTTPNNSANTSISTIQNQCIKCHLERILRCLRNVITALVINQSYLYYSQQIQDLPQIHIEILNINASIIYESNSNSMTQLWSSSVPNSKLSYPFSPLIPTQDNEQQNHYEQLTMHVERNQWGMVIVVYENNYLIDIKQSNEQITTNCSTTGCFIHQFPQFNNSSGIYLLCIMPYKQIPPHYHTILNEAELNLSPSVNRQVHHIISNNSHNAYQRTTWGITNHWRTEDIQQKQSHNDENINTLSILNHAHTYNNFSPYWHSVFCMSSPTFIPKDEIILGTPLHDSFKQRGIYDSLCLQQQLQQHEVLPLHPSNPHLPWLSDATWKQYFHHATITSPSITITTTTPNVSNSTSQNQLPRLTPSYIFPGCFKQCQQQIQFVQFTTNNSQLFQTMQQPNLSLDAISYRCADAVLGFTIIVGKNRSSQQYQQIIHSLSQTLSSQPFQIVPTSSSDSNTTHNVHYNSIGNNNQHPEEEEQQQHDDNDKYYFPQLLFTIHKSRGIELPGGKIDYAERISTNTKTIGQIEVEGIYREIHEETGIQLDPISNQNNIFPFARYIIDEQSSSIEHLHMTHNDNIAPLGKLVKHIKDVFIIVLSYEDISLQYQNNTQQFININNNITSIESECHNPFLRPLYDLIPSSNFLSNCIDSDSKVLSNNNTEQLLPQHKTSPLIQEQIFPICLRRLQAILYK